LGTRLILFTANYFLVTNLQSGATQDDGEIEQLRAVWQRVDRDGSGAPSG
jgi:hypothetical protein